MTSSPAYDVRSVAVSISLFSVLLCWASFPSAKESQPAIQAGQQMELTTVEAPTAANSETLKRRDIALPAEGRQSVPDHDRCRYAESFDAANAGAIQ